MCVIYFLFHAFASSQMMRELVPTDVAKMQSTSEWKRAINATYNQDAGMCQ